MRKWLSKRFFDAAVWLDWDTVADRAKLVVMVEMGFEDKIMVALQPPKKRGRPKGRKDGVGPKPKRGRPLGSKNKPKVVA
jgi:hypothetical protein